MANFKILNAVKANTGVTITEVSSTINDGDHCGPSEIVIDISGDVTNASALLRIVSFRNSSELIFSKVSGNGVLRDVDGQVVDRKHIGAYVGMPDTYDYPMTFTGTGTTRYKITLLAGKSVLWNEAGADKAYVGMCGAEIYENQRMVMSSVSASFDFENGGATIMNSRPIYFSGGGQQGIRP